ncbi:cupin domain-containing protein [Sphingopyxis sp.]|jgi:quercetin dioxygenase-like cupin family protein|uniref:cupin domain-containing protein n=1 Tax=Sphingopyxis sp. TaxID=1908224 RepID=UPI003F70D0E7
MHEAPFAMLSAKIVYDGDHRARRVDWPPRDRHLGAARSLLALWVIDDDASVHADHWERHPDGDETLLVIEGRLRLYLDLEGQSAEPIVIAAGEAAVVPAGLWHRLEVVEPGRLLTFTPVTGGELRPYQPPT